MTPTRIAGKLATALGQPITGSITITNPAFTSGDGTYVPAATATAVVASDGSYSFHLVPTYNASPFVYYTAQYHLLHGAALGTETWTVPPTTATLSIGPSIRVPQTIPPPPFVVQTSQIFSADANIGDALIWNGQQWTPTTIQQSFGFTFTNQTTLSIPASAHAQGASLLVAVYDLAGNVLTPTINVAPGVGDVTIWFGGATSGYGFLSGGLGRSLPNFSASFAGALSATIPQSQHRFATNNLAIAVYDTKGNLLNTSAAISVDSSLNVNVALSAPQTFTVVILGAIGATINQIQNTGGLTTPSVPYTVQVNSSTAGTITAATHGKGTSPIAFAFSNDNPPRSAALSYTRDSAGNLALSFGTFFTGTIEVISGAYQGVSTPFLASVNPASPVTSLSIPAAAHHQGAYAVPFAFSADANATAVSCKVTRSVVGDLTLGFEPPFSGAVQIVPGGWQGSSLYTQTVTAQTAVAILASAHGKGATALLDAFTADGSEADFSWTRDSVGNITATFEPAFTGVLQVFSAQ